MSVSSILTEALFKLLRVLGVYKVYEKVLLKQIKSRSLPSHIAFILDGNRRWARERGLPPWYGHEQGARKAEDVLRWCLELGIKTVSLYVLSTENLKRSPEEVSHILTLAEKYMEKALNEELFDKYKVKVKALGKIDLLPITLRKKIKALEEKTSNYDKHYLNICIAYGGRSEIVDAVKRICADVIKGKLKLEDIDEDVVKRYLYTSHLPNPEPDLVIRTSGEARISNFLLYQIAYSELLFLDVYWPDFRKIDLLRAIRIYQKRSRRFGR
ncbi:MAG: di-trans,poly-cis-decaprenylcistransferase [Thermoprotei archaeon]|nr:MAG: di-trans,poly-cis-decaprenylcistransferase [Thermoprotei archaeon]RLE98919.1 MAG: di-trans,poly-cis-decaprenylcistransferase [Thermoprotei archaeon]